MTTRATLALAFCLSLCSGILPSVAQDAAKAEPKKEAPKKEEPKRDPKVVEYEKAVKDLKRIDGPFPIYQRKRDILLELPEDKLEKVFLVQSTLNTALDGSLMHAGMPLGDAIALDAFKFVRNEEQLWLVRPNLRYRWEKDDPFAVGAERTYPEAILSQFRIEQSNPEKKLLLVNVSSLFLGEVFRLGEMVAALLGGPYQLDREKSFLEHSKGFPENQVFRMNLHFFSPRGASGPSQIAQIFALLSGNTLEDDRSAPFKVTYNLWWRKDTGYQPRLADPRVGYFTQDYFNLARYSQADRTTELINRFQLRKKDPNAAISEPIKPIVWTIDPSIPERHRPAVREGVMMWSKAFEAAGFKNAIQVQDPPKDDKDYDHADGRYNVIRFSPSDSSLFAAIALFRTDPFTGEILNASITIDGNVIADLGNFHDALNSGPTARTAALEVLKRDPSRSITDAEHLFDPSRAAAREWASKNLGRFGFRAHTCTHASCKHKDASLAWQAMQGLPAGTRVSRDEFIRQYIVETVAHEVGHCLGLRHNFAASTNLTTAQLADESIVRREGVSASVMDYNPPNAQAVLRGRGSFFSPTVGAYDVWAIRYGYSEFPGKTTIGERFDLARIARLSGVQGHAYKTDEDADTWDPYAVRFDLARDPIAYSERSLTAWRRAREQAVQGLPKQGEPYSKRTEVLLASLSRSFREATSIARFVGGIAGSRSFRGDVNAAPSLRPIDPALQRRATQMLVREFFREDVFKFPEDVLQTMTLSKDGSGFTAPVRDLVGTFQIRLAALLLSANTIDRIAENEYKTNSGKPYGVSEHYGTIVGASFAEIGAGRKVTPLRRDLQRFILTALMLQATAPQGAISEDARTVSSDTVKRLGKRFTEAAQASAKLDGMTQSHLRDSADQIERFLDREILGAR